MSNKETLQGYNETLNQYNTNLDDILNTINNLPENENLTEELDAYNSEVTEQEATIDTILKTLQTKAISGGGSMNNYSTEETVIGTWIDGKPIYRKVVNYGNLNSVQGTKSVEHGISDIDTITNINGICYEVNYAFNIPFTPTAHMFAGVTYAIRVDKTNIHIYVSDDRSVDTAIVTIEYTKTTD